MSQLSCKGVQYFDLKSRKEMNGHFLNPDILVFVCIQFLFPPCQSIDCCHANISCIFFIDFLSKWYHYFAPRLKNHCPLISYIDDNLKNKYFLCVVTSRHVKHPPRCQISAILVVIYLLRRQIHIVQHSSFTSPTRGFSQVFFWDHIL